LLAGFLRGVDIREHGSKNIGATNAVRVLGRPVGYVVFVLDVLKGTAPVLVAGWLLGALGGVAPDAVVMWKWLAVAMSAVLGHVFSPWVGFKGGKGVATGFGALLGVYPVITFAAIGAFVLWVVVVRLSRYVSLASIAAAAGLPVLVLASPVVLGWVGMGGGGIAPVLPAAVVTGVLGVLVIFKHRGNVRRLVAGSESKVGQGK
jgi:glycerol-3-phosphate acyltransferase PlsY